MDGVMMGPHEMVTVGQEGRGVSEFSGGSPLAVDRRLSTEAKNTYFVTCIF